MRRPAPPLTRRRSTFKFADTDQDGYLSPAELKRALMRHGMTVTSEDFFQLLAFLDRSMLGKVSYDDFVARVM